jgi:putative peptide-modifying radical SAM enzyme
MDWMFKIMDEIPAKRFIIQTNGTLLHQLPGKYLHDLHTVLLSIDGRKEITDYYRGRGTYETVIKNARLIRSRGYEGELTARMCVSEESDIYKEVTHLNSLKDHQGAPLFNGIHWQNNFMFSDRDSWRDLDGWLDNSYYPGIEKLVKNWVNEMIQRKRVQLIYPFIGIMKTMLDGKPAKLHCGCGHFNNNICTDGKITACPVSSDFYPVFEIGNIYENILKDFFDAMTVDEPCPDCDLYSICGGRCLYANKLKPWGENGYKEVCNTIRHLINTLKVRFPEIKGMLDEGILELTQFEYFKYQGCEIIP